MAELARRAGIAKSTLSQLEAGIGNPALETLWALAMALAVPISQLIEQPRQRLQVIRANEGPTASAGQADYAVTLLANCPAGARRDIYRLRVQPGNPRRSNPHLPDTLEHVILCSGSALVGPLTQPVQLEAGDYMCYSADGPHTFEALVADTTAVMLIEHA